MLLALITYVLTVALLWAFGAQLNAIWNAGYWYLVAPLPFLILGAAYAHATEQERADFRDDLLSWFRARPSEPLPLSDVESDRRRAETD